MTLAEFDILKTEYDKDGVIQFSSEVIADKFYNMLIDKGFDKPCELELSSKVIFYDASLDDITRENLEYLVDSLLELTDIELDNLYNDYKKLNILKLRLERV